MVYYFCHLAEHIHSLLEIFGLAYYVVTDGIEIEILGEICDDKLEFKFLSYSFYKWGSFPFIMLW